MSSEITVKIQSLLWWVSSIAVSVLCCSMLFVVFASYVVEIKATMRNNDARIAGIEAREDKILFEIDALQKRLPPVAVAPVAPVAPPATSAGDAEKPAIAPSVSAPTPSTPAPSTPVISTPVITEPAAPISSTIPTPVPVSSATPTIPAPAPEKK